MKLSETAARIQAHYDRFDAEDDLRRKKEPHWTGGFYRPSAYRGGRFVMLKAKTYWRAISVEPERAEKYLEWLDAGNRGDIYDYRRAQEAHDLQKADQS